MKKAKIAIFTGTKQSIAFDEIIVPKLKPGQILLENHYTTLCRSDLNTYSGKRFEKVPTILGHEIVGRIAEISKGAPRKDLKGNSLHVNDRITWGIYSSDPESKLSKRGIPQKAENLFKYGHEEITKDKTLHGGLGQYTILQPNTPIVKLDEKIPDTVAALINCSVATVAGAIRLAGNLEGKNILVSGAGMLGLVACSMVDTVGAASVSAIDVDKKRATLALDFGARHFFDAKADLEPQLKEEFGISNPFDVVLELSGAASAMENTLKSLIIGGSAIWVGGTFPQRNLNIDSEYLIRNLLKIKGLHNYNENDFVKAADFITQYHTRYPFSRLVVDFGGLDQVNEAFEHGLHTDAFRVGIQIKSKTNSI